MIQIVFADVVLAAFNPVSEKSKDGCSGIRHVYLCSKGLWKDIGCNEEQDLYQVDDRL